MTMPDYLWVWGGGTLPAFVICAYICRAEEEEHAAPLSFAAAVFWPLAMFAALVLGVVFGLNRLVRRLAQ